MIEDFDEEPAAASATDVAEEPSDPEPATPPPAPPSPEEIAILRASAYAQGRADERVEMDAARAAAVARDLGSLVAALRDTAGAAAQTAELAAEETAKLLLGVLGGMMPALLARHGAADIRALLAAVLPSLVHEPRVTIRVCPELCDMVGDELARVAPEMAPRVELTAAAAMTQGDIRIAWNGGAASRDTAELWSRIVASLAPLGLLDPFARPRDGRSEPRMERETAHV